MKHPALLVLCLCAFTADGASLLVLTEPTDRGISGGVFDRWIAQIVREGWSVSVREIPRWNGNWTSNDWTTLNRMSNEVARANPDAVQLVGHMPWLITGKHGVDGHVDRCITTHHWLNYATVTATNNSVSWVHRQAGRYGGYMPWEYPICGDRTLPIGAVTAPPPGVATVEMLVVQ